MEPRGNESKHGNFVNARTNAGLSFTTSSPPIRNLAGGLVVRVHPLVEVVVTVASPRDSEIPASRENSRIRKMEAQRVKAGR